MKALIDEVIELLPQLVTPPEEPLPPPPATNEQIDRFERQFHLRVPDELRQWLLVTNGPCVGPGGVFGIETKRAHLDIGRCLASHPVWIAKGWIPIAGDGCGNYYLAVTRQDFGEGEPVIFIDTMEGDDCATYVVASSILKFLRFLFLYDLGRSGWPFRKAEVIASDPAIESFVGVPMPWEA